LTVPNPGTANLSDFSDFPECASTISPSISSRRIFNLMREIRYEEIDSKVFIINSKKVFGEKLNLQQTIVPSGTSHPHGFCGIIAEQY
jgi:hypothetical protein